MRLLPVRVGSSSGPGCGFGVRPPSLRPGPARRGGRLAAAQVDHPRTPTRHHSPAAAREQPGDQAVPPPDTLRCHASSNRSRSARWSPGPLLEVIACAPAGRTVAPAYPVGFAGRARPPLKRRDHRRRPPSRPTPRSAPSRSRRSGTALATTARLSSRQSSRSHSPAAQRGIALVEPERDSHPTAWCRARWASSWRSVWRDAEVGAEHDGPARGQRDRRRPSPAHGRW